MSKYALDLEKYGEISRMTQAEGCVLLENENKALPLREGDQVAVFGRSAFNYYKSGLGSGGLVNTRYVVSILDALKEEKSLSVDENLMSIYEKWIEANPFDEGEGWGKVPWSQKEMPVTDEMVDIAKSSDAALIMIGRTAGEDQDNKVEEGAYLLSKEETELIEKVSAVNPRTVVVLNVGNIIDMKWVQTCKPAAVVYAWQGGQEGGHGVVDMLTGRVNACGRLTDTIAMDIEDYPSTKNFGDVNKNIYAEDIYVGYRYFETFAKDKVLYPFGYGLSYTTFEMESDVEATEGTLKITTKVTNTGDVAGKEVVQVYIKVPSGKLGQPARKLIGYAKTDVIASGESEVVSIEIPKYTYASYDDAGVTGNKSCYVLEEGTYEIYVGANVREAVCAGSYNQEYVVLEQLSQAYAPVEVFDRMKATEVDGQYVMSYEAAPLSEVDMEARIKNGRAKDIPYTGDQGYKLIDVFDGKIDLDTFVAQLSDEEMIHMFRGEGMCSSKVTPGTAAAFGGVTDALKGYGIPAACCADGPSGIRMDCGTKAFSLPNGTALGCTYNDALVKELYIMTGQELRLNKIDSLLGPGMNIHRNPLNGRNFEYISEDPLVTGKISAAQLEGMATYGIGSTIKHFCANNQELARRKANAVISERALREIYLKGFEIAVKEGKARSIMTTYGSVNGLWTAGSYDLNTTILRNEWGFDGIVMTDWWAEANYPGQDSKQTIKAPMAAAQNDLYMVVQDTIMNPENDDMEVGLKEGIITRSDLCRNSKNILGFILKSPALMHLNKRIDPEELEEMNKKGDNDFSAAELVYYLADKETGCVTIDGSVLNPKAGNADVFGISMDKFGIFTMTFEISSDLNPLAQLPISIYFDNTLKGMISIQGTEGKTISVTTELGVIFGVNHFIKLYYGANGMDIKSIKINLVKAMTLDDIFNS